MRLVLEPVGIPELLSNSYGRNILAQDRTRVVVFCEGFDTEQNPQVTQSMLRDLWTA